MVDLQIAVWGPGAEIVPASVLLVSVKRGGILIGAFDGSTLIGFVWSFLGRRLDQPMHWSHMLAVAPLWRDRGIGEALKRRQRDAAIAKDIELIEWTFDPLQAVNAHLNLSRLGAIARTYEINVYGEIDSPLMRGTPTDRLVAEWWLTRPHVTRRLTQDADRRPRSRASLDAVSAIHVGDGRRWPALDRIDLNLDERRVLVPVPANFTEMQRTDHETALQWRLGVREAFTHYFSRGYCAVDFLLDRARGDGAYLLAVADEP